MTFEVALKGAAFSVHKCHLSRADPVFVEDFADFGS
jgi:hypothetical protein